MIGKRKVVCWKTAVCMLGTILAISLVITSPVQADGTPNIEHMPLFARTGNNDSPFAIYLTVSNLNENTDYEFTVRVNHSGTDRGSFTTSGGFGTAYVSLGTTPTGCGTECSLSSWVFIRATATVPAEPSNLRIRTRVVGAATPPFNDLPGPSFLDMITAGGWLEESTGTARDGRAVAVFNASDLVGLYIAKANGVNDGYPGESGYYRLAVPDCADCGYRLETWELDNPGISVGQINTMGEDSCPDSVGVGLVQSLNSCHTPTAVFLAAISTQTTTARMPFILLLLIPLTGTVFWFWRRYPV
jgi:hypothetical protein